MPTKTNWLTDSSGVSYIVEQRNLTEAEAKSWVINNEKCDCSVHSNLRLVARPQAKDPISGEPIRVLGAPAWEVVGFEKEQGE